MHAHHTRIPRPRAALYNMAEHERPRIYLEMDECLERRRIRLSVRNLLLIPYLPMGFLVLVIRLCMTLQLVLVFALIPNGWFKRVFLRIYISVLGLVVVTRDFHMKQDNARMMVCNKVSHLDHIPLHLALDCITTSTGRVWPVLASLFNHHTFNTEQEELVVGEAKMLPEFDDTVSVPDSAVTPFVAQPECTPTNTSYLMKFRSWCFAVDSAVQPIAVSWWRLHDVKMSTVEGSGWWDLFWVLFLPFTIVQLRMLPVVEMEEKDTPQQFADKVQQQLAVSLGARCCSANRTDYSKWLNDPPCPSPPKVNPPTTSAVVGPYIPEAEFPHIPENMDSMVEQVTSVLPQVPHTVVRSQLMLTRSVDVTISSLLDGRVQYDPIPTLHDSLRPTHTNAVTTETTQPKKPKKLTIKDCHQNFEERKKSLLEQARRRYFEKHGLPSH